MMRVAISGVVGRKAHGDGESGPYYSARVDYIGGAHTIYFRGEKAKQEYDAFPPEGEEVTIQGKGAVAATGKNAGKLSIDNIKVVGAEEGKPRVARAS